MSQHHGMPGLYPAALCSPNHVQEDGDRFGRMFDLPPLFTDPEVLKHVARANGPMKGKTNTTKADRTKSVPVGHVFFGQFIDHDITLDVASSFETVNDPSDIPNTRTPTLDLDCIYGSGPEASNFLYENAGPFKGIKLIHDTNDLQRNGQGVAIIGDFRNDENRIVSQIQLGMIRLHNFFCDELQGTVPDDELFEHARETTTWHYQWAVVFDFLTAMCGEAVVRDVLSNGRKFYTPYTPYIPVEFSVAAYRYGHSMAPQKIQIQSGGAKHTLFGGDLGSFEPVADPLEIVDWPEVFKIPGGGNNWQRAEKLDSKMAPILLNLPFIGDPEPFKNSLAARNLVRGQSFLLPSGEQVAAAMGFPEKKIKDVSEAALGLDKNLAGGTPLWLYVLLEAEVLGRGGDAKDRGEGMGPVGGRIVTEVMIGLLERDPRSWLSTDRSWSPAPDRRTIGELLSLPPKLAP